MAKPEEARLWRILRRLLPRWYRDRWGDALLRAHVDRVGGDDEARGFGFWPAVAWDVLLTAVQTRWMDEGWSRASSARAAERPHHHDHVTTTTGGRDMTDLARDLRITLRTLFRSPAYLASAVATLGLGIGVATTIFSLVNGALLRPLPFPDPDQLMFVRDHYRSTSGSGSMSVPNYLDLRRANSSLEGFAAYSVNSLNLTTDGSSERIRALSVTHDFLETLELEPLLGRDFSEGEDRIGRPAVTLIGHALWRERFGGDRNVVGRTLLLNGEAYSVAGVLPEDFWFEGDPRLLIPFQWDLEQQGRGGRWLYGVGRLREGMAPETAEADLRNVFGRLEEEYPVANDGWTVSVQGLKERTVGSERTAFYLLSAASALLLLIGCVNVTNLMLVRGERRRGEMAVRAALGGGRRPIARQFLVEGLLVTALAGVVGAGVAYGGIEVLTSLWGSDLPRAGEIGIDAAALGFSLVVALTVGIIVGLVPSVRIDLGRLYSGLREGGRGGSPGQSVVQRVLVGTEVALAVILVTGAGLLVSSAREVARIDPGVELEEALVFSVQLPSSGYPGPDAVQAYFREALDRIEALPGVEAAGISPRTPLQGGYNVTTVPSPVDPDLTASFVEIRTVTPGFFEAAGISLLEGRNFQTQDADAGAAGVLISDALARSLFPDRSAVGQTVDPFGNETHYRIVGVVESVREFGLLRDERPAIYWAFGYPALGNVRNMTFVVRAGDPLALVPEIRNVLTDLDPTIPVYSIRTMEDVATQTLGARTLATQLFTAFAAMALLLTGVGIFGILAYLVEQRTREIGIRMAIGANRGEVVGMVIGQALKLVGAGLAVGVAISVASGRFLEDLLYQVEPGDPLVLVGVLATVLAAATAAAWLPARKAAGVAPSQALRED